MGSVLFRGRVMNSDTSTWSKEVMNANKAPTMRPGRIAGIVTAAKVRTGVAPRSIAASSCSRANVRRLAETTDTTNGRPSRA